jgi:DinB superfamily
MTAAPDGKFALLRHLLAALAYRTQKAVGGAPEDFGEFRAAPGVRTPRELVHHMVSVLGFAGTHWLGGAWRPPLRDTLAAQLEDFHEMLESLSRHLAAGEALLDTTPERLLQGPFADAMTHAGQLAMLRRLAGSPIPPEDFIVADIHPDRLGPDQRSAVSPDAEWQAAEDEPR